MIRAVVSDFGGVPTTPLLEGFARFQDDTGVQAEFVDDVAVNVEAARALEFAVVQFRDADQAIAELDALIGASP